MDTEAMGAWISGELQTSWPGARLLPGTGLDGNYTWVIGEGTQDFRLILGHHVMDNATSEDVIHALEGGDWIVRLQEDGCVLVTMVKNNVVLGGCPAA